MMDTISAILKKNVKMIYQTKDHTNKNKTINRTIFNQKCSKTSDVYYIRYEHDTQKNTENPKTDYIELDYFSLVI